MSTQTATARARAALSSIRIDDGSPFGAAEARVLRSLGLANGGGDEAARIAYWESRHPGSRAGDDRYRWEIAHRHVRPAAHAGDPTRWRVWRPDVERDPERAEVRISLPLSIAEHADRLLELAASGGPLATRAAALVTEAEPLFRRDLAPHIQCSQPWTDTFALFVLARRPFALARLHPLAVAMAVSQSATVKDGAVHGLQFPFHDVPLASASAQLAGGLLALGIDVPTLADLVRFVRRAMHADAGWRDDLPPSLEAKFPPRDPLATFAAVDLLAHLDPSFDPAPSIAAMLADVDDEGFLVAMGPERAWLTGELLLLANEAAGSFAERFRFPAVPSANLDRKTGLPFYAHFDDLALLFAAIDGVARSPAPLAFIDLAGFREFNNRYGQDQGDAVLAAFAAELRTIPGARVVRDGGDEFLVVGAPARAPLEADLDRLRHAWPARFAALFGDAPPVAPRILVTRPDARDLRAAREMLGKTLGSVKLASKSPPPEGVLHTA